MKILDVIKCEQDNALLVWKHPAEDFNTASTLIVHESQEEDDDRTRIYHSK